jgi:hypothetical protein
MVENQRKRQNTNQSSKDQSAYKTVCSGIRDQKFDWQFKELEPEIHLENQMRERKNQHELDSSKHRGKKINSQP